MEVDIEQVKKLVKLVEKHQLEELTVEDEGFSLTIKGPTAAIAPVPVVVSSTQANDVRIQAAVSGEELIESAIDEAEESHVDVCHYKIVSPMVGVFYRSPSPDAPSYIEVGDTIEVGQTIGLIEAMKVFSEIPSEVAGEVVELPTANGKLVQQGEPLVVVKVKE